MMTEQLKPSQREQGNKIADVQAVRRRVEAAIKYDRLGEAFSQLLCVRAVGDEAAPFQFIKNAHAQRLICQKRGASCFPCPDDSLP